MIDVDEIEPGRGEDLRREIEERVRACLVERDERERKHILAAATEIETALRDFAPGMCYPCRTTGWVPDQRYEEFCKRKGLDPWSGEGRFAWASRGEEDDENGSSEDIEPMRGCDNCQGAGLVGASNAERRLHATLKLAWQRQGLLVGLLREVVDLLEDRGLAARIRAELDLPA